MIGGGYGGNFPNETRNAGRQEGVNQDIERAEHKQQADDAAKMLRASGHLKVPWYRRLFKRGSHS